MQKLFTEFNTTSAAQWKEQLVKDLKGVDFEQLKWHTDNGFDINPFYTKEDLKTEASPLFSHHDWEIATFINVEDEKKANAMALEALNGGVSSLSFCLNGDKNVSVLLKDIQIEYISIQFILNNEICGFETQLNQLIAERKLKAEDLNIVVNYDVLAHLVEHGNWLESKEYDLADVLKTSQLSFNKHKLLVDASLYQNSGANQVTELALILSHYNEYLNFFNDSKFDFSTLKNGIQINVAIGSDFFGEIAKLRALRKLIALVNSVYAVEAPIYISCSTSQLTLASKDVHTNLLRTTTQAMSAVIGGCNTLHVSQFDELLDTENKSLSNRMARNQQIILKEESYLNKAADISAGSYYLENLTEQMAINAFELFKTWEAKGGFIACLENNTIQTLIGVQAKHLKDKVASGEIVIIGVNKFINTTEKNHSLKHTESKSITHLFEPIKVLHLAESIELNNPVIK